MRASVVTDALVYRIGRVDEHPSADGGGPSAALRVHFLLDHSSRSGGARAASVVAQRVIFAAPIFSAARIISGWNDTWPSQFTYAPWLVANLHLRQRPDGHERFVARTSIACALRDAASRPRSVVTTSSSGLQPSDTRSPDSRAGLQGSVWPPYFPSNHWIGLISPLSSQGRCLGSGAAS